MNRPDKKNAITRSMYAAMAEALTTGDADPGSASTASSACRAHSRRQRPPGFHGDRHGRGRRHRVYDFLMALAKAEKPIVSAADGIAVGIGTTIHFHCDLTFATPRTVFHTTFVDLGLVPEAGSSLLAPRVLGRQGAFRAAGSRRRPVRGEGARGRHDLCGRRRGCPRGEIPRGRAASRLEAA